LIGAAGLAVGLGGPVPAAWTWPAVAIGGLLVLIGAAWLAVGGGAGRTRRAAADELAELENVRRLAARADREERIAQVEREQAEQLGRLGLALPAAEALLERASGHAARLDTLRAEQRGLVSRLGGEAPAEADDINALRDRAAAEIDECRHALAGMGELGRQPEQRLAALRAQIERATVERDSGRDAVARAEERLAANEVDAEQVAATAEALTGARTALAAGERRLRIYSEALNALNVAEQRTMKAAARFLEQHMAADVARISGGRYSQLRIDETSLAFSLFSAEAGEWIEARRLSRGTVDQLYLCARLGIVRQITGTARPPLILDDPFVTFDARRARRALELLRDVARDHQVLLLTCADRYDDLAEQVTVLPPPDTAASTPAPKAIAPAPAAPAPAPAEERATQLPLMTEVV
ncbi:MAG TPA: hypothetical protein VNW68_03255, partial [Candidatus Limnocylindria bacterium]|nr:hypothetical protein [Candidatus Limnocylindria bacterium]